MSILTCMRLHGLVLFIAGVLYFSAAWAGGSEPFEPIDAQALIDSCKAKYEEKVSSRTSNAAMREGSIEVIRCYKSVILDQTDALFKSEIISRRMMKEKLDRIIKDYGEIYWLIFNAHRDCRIPGLSCGTMYNLFHYGRIDSILEKMIHDMIRQRNEYEL